MRRWQLLSPFWRDGDLRDRGRALLFLEQLEGREVLAPVVTSPIFATLPQTLEGVTRVFSGDPAAGGESFSVSDVGAHTVAATLSSTRGTFTVDENTAQGFGVSVTNNGTSSVTLTGPIDFVRSVLQSGFTFTPSDYFSGDALINLSVADLEVTGGDAGLFVVQVTPDASSVSLDWSATGELRGRTEPFAFPPGFLSVSNWPDTDGSETFRVTLVLDADDPAAIENFGLSANGIAVTPLEPGLWQVEGTDPATFQTLLDSLVLTPPDDYSGRVSITAFGINRDRAFYPSDGSMLIDPRSAFAGAVDLRFFEDAEFTTPTVFVQEGTGPIDLGGRYAVEDPAELPEDLHTLTISAPRGTLTFDSATVPSGVSAGQDGNTILLTGDLAAIDTFLATPGSLTYTIDDPAFTGPVELTFILVNHPGDAFEFPSFPGGQFGSALAEDGPPPTVAVAVVAFMPITHPPGTPTAPGDASHPTGGPPRPGPDGPVAPSSGPKSTSTSTSVFGQPGPSGAPGAPGGPSGESGGSEGGRGGGPGGGPGGPGGGPGGPGGPGGGPGGPGGPRVPFVALIGDVGPRDAVGNPDGSRGAPTPITQPPPFARIDAQPLYIGEGGRHPLPPVLPLDQTLPVAGFSESAGDSLALIDLIYRDANPEQQHTVSPINVSFSTGLVAPNIVATTAADETAPVSVSDGVGSVPPETAEASESSWLVYVVVASLATWLARGRVAALVRSARRLFRIPNRQHTEGTT